VVFVLGTVVLLELGARWSQRWAPAAVDRAGIFAYRRASLHSGASTVSDESPA